MIDLLLDPAIIGIVGTVGGGAVIKLVEKRGEKKGIRKARAEFTASASVSVNEIEAAKERPSVYTCEIYGQRLLEDRLHEAGIIDLMDMDVCEEASCLMCKDIRANQSAVRRAKHQAAVDAAMFRESAKSEQEKKYAGVVTRNQAHHLSKRKEQRRAGRITCCTVCATTLNARDADNYMCSRCVQDAAEKERKSLRDYADVPKRTSVTYLGQKFIRPKDVPPDAVAHGLTNGIRWHWKHYDGHGGTYPVPIAAHYDQSRSDVHDPYTGEYLGTIPEATITFEGDDKVITEFYNPTKGKR